MSHRVFVCRAAQLRRGVVLPVPIGVDAAGKAREAIILRDEDGRVRAYVNRCQHIPLTLDMTTRQFLDLDGRHLRCLNHGAIFRLHDGYCTAGPCRGESLQALTVEESGGCIYLLDG